MGQVFTDTFQQQAMRCSNPYLYASPAALPLLGYPPEELIGSSSASLFHPDDLASTGRTLARVLNISAPMHSQYRVIRKDGRVIWLETTGQAIRDPQSGAVVEVIAVWRDCTVRVEMEAALRESEQRYRSICFQLRPDDARAELLLPRQDVQNSCYVNSSCL